MNADSQSRRENVLSAHVTMCKYAQTASGGHARQVIISALRGTGAAERSGNVTDTSAPVQYQHSCQPAGIIFIVRIMDYLLHQTYFVPGNWCYDRHRYLVVGHFNIIEDICSGQILGFVDPFPDTLFFQRTEERFGHHIILAVAIPAYSECQIIGPAETLPVVAAVLATLIAMYGFRC